MQYYIRLVDSCRTNFYWNKIKQTWYENGAEATLFNSENLAENEAKHVEAMCSCEVEICIKRNL